MTLVVPEVLRPSTSDATEALLSDALVRVVACQDSCQVLESCKYGLSLLESTPVGSHADKRIELGWNIAKALVHDFTHIGLCIRALLAAFPSGAIAHDRTWERKWLTAVGVIERMRGNVAQALKAELAGLALAQQIGDIEGQAASLGNLTAHAVLTARFDEALRLSAAAIEAATKGAFLDALVLARLNRGTAYLYLGRYEECLENAQQALVAVGSVAEPVGVSRVVLAKVLAAEALIALGRYDEAKVAVEAARCWSKVRKGWTKDVEVERISALLDVARGEVQRGIKALQELRASAAATNPSVFVDLLQSEYRAHVMAEDRSGAIQVLKDLRDWFIAQAEEALRAAVEPTASPVVDLTARMADVDEYLEARRLLAGVIQPATPSWELLVSLAASSSGLEQCSLEHGLRVGRLSALVGAALGLDAETQDKLEAAGLVHDVGKVGVPREVLMRSDSLSEEEQSLYEAHTDLGAQLIEQAAVSNKRFLANVARYHHVAFDGLGRGHSRFRGRDIPIEARIVAVCDSFDVLITGRLGRPPVSTEQALQEIFARSGRDFDPQIVDALVDVTRALPHGGKRLITALSVRANEIAFFASRRALHRVTTQGAR